jgi:hypothetical protein
MGRLFHPLWPVWSWNIEDKVIANLDFRPAVYKRYVDDIFAIIPADRVSTSFDEFNAFHVNFEFTMEIEQDGFLPFLDFKIIYCDSGSVLTDLYKKPTWTGRYLNYLSNLPLTYIRNTVSLMTGKILQMSSLEFCERNLDLLKKTLASNGYPMKFVDKTICETITKHQGAVRPVNRNCDPPPKFMSMPYIPGCFEKFKFFMRKYNVKVIGKGENSVRKNVYTHLKDSGRTDVQLGVVYQVKFSSCQLMYIGNTIQYMKKWMYE